jgi:hypothetical protein
MNVVVEYLVLLASDGTFCSTETAFNQLLQVDSRITLNGDQLRFQDPAAGVEFSCKYSIWGGDVQGKPQRFFQLTFSAQADDATPDDDLDQFSALLRAVRSVVARAHDNRSQASPECLWDDISAYYSQKAYPLLHEVENLMRRLIANFMLITVGKEWVTETSPKDFTEALSKSKRKGTFNNQLHTVDFIDLADFLLKPYPSKQADQLYERLRKLKKGETLTAEDLRDYVPRSNWQRYFAKLVACEDQYLNSRWQELYELRCQVAHNAQFERRDFERVRELTADLGDKLRAALGKLPQVTVPKEEQETVAEEAATRLYPRLGEFITAWQLLEATLLQRARITTRIAPIGQLARELQERGELDGPKSAMLQALWRARNQIVHQSGTTYSEAELAELVQEVWTLLEFLKKTGEGGTQAPPGSPSQE